MIDPKAMEELEKVNDERVEISPLNPHEFEMTLPIRLDIAAALAYPLGIFGAIGLLIGEHRNDLIRFHAWQSFILNLTLLMAQFLVGLWLGKVGWIVMMMSSVGLGCYLGWMAYRYSPALKVFYLPIFGTLAAKWLHEE